MDVFILLKLLCCFFLLAKFSDANSCIPAKCSLNSPEIQFPFRIQGLHPPHCGLPGFNLFCRENKTMIRFPNYGDLAVKSIDYHTRRLDLIDQKNCVHEVFLNMNLSLTPFSYYYVLKQYKYINCSDKLVGSLEQVPCLSGSNRHVYVIEPSFEGPVSCSLVKTVAVPFSYSPYLSDSSFGLGLTWDAIGFDEGKAKLGREHGSETGLLEKHFRVSGIITIFIMVGILSYATFSQFRVELKNDEEVKGAIGEVEIDKLLGEYEALAPASDAHINVKSL